MATSLEFTDAARERAAKILDRYPEEYRKSAVVPLLHLAQEEWGYVSPEAMACVAGLIGCSPVKVAEIATFYPMFNKEPVGEHVLAVCHTLPCALTGCGSVFDHLSEKLGIGLGETTEDGRFTLRKSECLAACDRGPVLLVNRRLHTHVSPEKVDEILAELDKGSR